MIGFYIIREDLEEFACYLAKFGAAYSIPVALIYPDNLQKHYFGEPLTAKVWSAGEFIECEIELPLVLDTGGNILSHQSTVLRDKAFSSWLNCNTKLIIQSSFTKDMLAQAMICNGLSEYAIPTWKEYEYEAVIKKLSLMKNVLIKPSGGRKGQGVIKLSRSSDGEVLAISPDETVLFSNEFFINYLRYNRNNKLGEAVLVQPFLDFMLDSKHALDFRLLRHRGETGVWEEVATYARIGVSPFVSNIAQGGYIGDAKETLQLIAGERGDMLYEEIIHIGELIPQLIQKYRGDRAFCLGIDVAVDRRTLMPYVLETNTYPGCKYHLRELAEKRVQFYKYILKYSKQD